MQEQDIETARDALARLAKPTRGRPPKDITETTQVRILRGYFPLDGRPKQQRGSVITVTKAEARVVIALGVAESADEA